VGVAIGATGGAVLLGPAVGLAVAAIVALALAPAAGVAEAVEAAGDEAEPVGAIELTEEGVPPALEQAAIREARTTAVAAPRIGSLIIVPCQSFAIWRNGREPM
jgi:hypothetical protein